MKPFLFKKFAIYQDKTAMKVGTDGVLLGAWVKAENPKRILDIGTGTGLIALMLAQRFSTATIEALEINEAAFLQAKSNFAISSWSSRLQAIHSALQDYKNSTKFDLIVSNPPYFESLKQVKTAREQARQTESLSFEVLIQSARDLLNDKGTFALILPIESKEKVLALARESKLYPKAICTVFGTKTSKAKRVLIQFSKIKTTCQETELIIEISRHNYTKEYIALTKDFYLKM